VTPEQLVHTYLDALGSADLPAMLTLFSADGQVSRPGAPALSPGLVN
jgi:ketosteroid isomerase-like protein